MRSVLLFFLPLLASSTYIVTCHNEDECGTVCGKYSNDMVAPSEGIFSTSCSCQSGGTTQKCTYNGMSISQCSDGKAPSCKTACGQKICISKDSKKATGTIYSACPKHHPQNVQQCCQYKNDAYCTCCIQDTLDLNAQPYQQLGNDNGYSSSAVWGACGSSLSSLEIHINTTRAAKLVEPFVKSGEHCRASDSGAVNVPPVDPQCEGLDRDGCNARAECTFCSSDYFKLPTKCYEKEEAMVLQHIVGTEVRVDAFTCDW